MKRMIVGVALKGGYVYLHPGGAWSPGVVPSPVNGQNARRCLYAAAGSGDWLSDTNAAGTNRFYRLRVTAP